MCKFKEIAAHDIRKKDTFSKLNLKSTKHKHDSSCAYATVTITMTYPSQGLTQARNRSTH